MQGVLVVVKIIYIFSLAVGLHVCANLSFIKAALRLAFMVPDGAIGKFEPFTWSYSLYGRPPWRATCSPTSTGFTGVNTGGTSPLEQWLQICERLEVDGI